MDTRSCPICNEDNFDLGTFTSTCRKCGATIPTETLFGGGLVEDVRSS